MLANGRGWWLACGLVVGLAVAMWGVTAWATDAEVYLSRDFQGQILASQIREGCEVYVCVYDPDQNIDPATREKMWAELLIMDPKTGAFSIWDTGGYYGLFGDPAFDYLEETAANTGLFVSKRALQIGTRLNHTVGRLSTHVVDTDRDDFRWGDFLYARVGGGQAIRFALDPAQLVPLGRFENMDTVIVWYRDPNDETDVAVFQAKITDTQGTVEWDQEVYPLTGPGSEAVAATLVVRDDDENLSPNEVEYVPVFVLVNPGSWNPVQTGSTTDFWMLKNTGGVDLTGRVLDQPIRWHTIYDSGLGAVYPANAQPQAVGTYYVQYPTANNVLVFDTDDPNGFARVMFYAQETGIDTGVFQLNLNSVLSDLGFDSFNVRDVLVAYYVDPNDFDDVALDIAYATEKQHSLTAFTDSQRQGVDVYSLGRDRLYVQVIDANANVDPCSPEPLLVHVYDLHAEDDAEWLTATEVSANSPVFFTTAQTRVDPAWSGLGAGAIGAVGLGGYQLQLDNFRVEAFNEDTLIARYNDVYYRAPDLLLLGDGDPETGFPPTIDRPRVGNDLSIATAKVFDTQVFDGTTPAMHFMDRNGSIVFGYTNSDCAFIRVVDPDQNEDPQGRERIDAYWDGEQNLPFGPMALNQFGCPFNPVFEHPINRLFGDTNILNDGDEPKIYILNPRNGRWAGVDLLETGNDTGDFVSVSCVQLTSAFECVPTLGVLPGDTILAFYQDPSNHSDVCVIGIKVGPGGGGDPSSTTTFTDAAGNEVASYTDADDVYVKVVDASHAGEASIPGAVGIEGQAFDLQPLVGALTDTFIAGPISMTTLGVNAGDSITATYTDPTNPADVSSDTISIIHLIINCWFTYTLEGVNPAASTFTLRLEGHAGTNPAGVAVGDWHWQFQDGTEDDGQVVTHTFAGLGDVFSVILNASAGAATCGSVEWIWGIGGILGSLEDAFETADPSHLQLLQAALSWAGGSVEKLYRACVDAALELYGLAEPYGLVSATQLAQALSTTGGPLAQLWPVPQGELAAILGLLREAMAGQGALLGRLPGLGQLLAVTSTPSSVESRELSGSITLPQLYEMAEDLATFLDGLLDDLAPVAEDETFALQVPTCLGCTPNVYVSLDNGDIAGILAVIAAGKALLESLVAYTPGDLFMANLEFEIYPDGSLEVRGWDVIEETLLNNIQAAGANGILDLDGSGDGDGSLGHELFPGSFLTLRSAAWLISARANLLRALDWLRTCVTDMPATPGPHDPQIEWPLVLSLFNRPPVAQFSYAYVEPGNTVQFDASGSYDADGTIGAYRWDFGDGSVEVGSGVIVTHTYAEPPGVSLYTVTLRVTDDDGASDTATTAVRIPEEPVAATARQRSGVVHGASAPQVGPLVSKLRGLPVSRSISVSKDDVLRLIDTIQACLLGPTAVDLDIDLDGVVDYSTLVNLAPFFDEPLADLKDLLPDLVVTADPNDPLLVLSSDIEGIDQNWKLDGVLSWTLEQVSIDFPDPTIGGALPHGDANDLLALLLFGHGNTNCQERRTVLGAAGWHMVSVPGRLCDPCSWTNGEICGNLACAFDDDFASFFAYHYDSDQGHYNRVPPAEAICHKPGMSVWIYTPDASREIDAHVIVADGLVELPLGNGWNQVGNPYAFAIGQDALTIRRGGEQKTLLQAQDAGWISAKLYAYDTWSGNYVEIPMGTGYLPTWTGAWLRTFAEGCTLVLSPYPAPPPPPGAALPGRRLGTREAAELELPPPPPWVPVSAQEVVASLSVRNVPNPIRSEHTTVFTVQGAGAEHVDEIRVDIYGQNGARVFSERIDDIELVWHTVNDAGELLANGVYLYQVWVRIDEIWYPLEIRKLAVVR